MRPTRCVSVVLVSTLFCVSAAAQQVPQRDVQAVAILQQSLVAMGGSVPTDSVATGTIVVVAGSTTETGTVRVLSRGVDQSSEHIQTTAGNRAVIFSPAGAAWVSVTDPAGISTWGWKIN